MARNRGLGAILIFTAIVTVLYWLNYYTGGDVKTVDARWYTAFEDAFPVADGWMAIACLIAGAGYWRGRRFAIAWGLLAGSALLYLAGMDIAFNVENGLYGQLATSDPMKFELFINVWCVALGVILTAHALKGFSKGERTIDAN